MLDAIQVADMAAFRWASAARAAWLDVVMPVASDLGRGGLIWLAIGAVAALVPARRMAAWRLALAVGLSALVVDGLIKPVAERARPYAVLDDVRVIHIRPATGSFPSGHAAIATAGALAAGRIFPTARLGLWALAGLVALSRIYVGVHWPSDVLAGIAVGLACGWFALGGPRTDQRRLF